MELTNDGESVRLSRLVWVLMMFLGLIATLNSVFMVVAFAKSHAAAHPPPNTPTL